MKRIVAYIYRYQKDNGALCRCGNMGFCRVEQNGDKCVVVLCLKDICGVEGTADISILKKAEGITEKENYIKVELNKCHSVSGGVLNVKLNMDNSDGVCVECCGRIYIALWIECAQNIELVENADNVKHEKLRHEELKHEEPKREEPKYEQSKCEVLKHQESKQEKPKYDKTKRDQQNVSKRELEEYTRIYNRLCKVRMVLNGEEYPAVKLRIHELIMLPRSCWRMANNIFLMESYYRYGHILFMQYENKYILAVPWQNKRGVEAKAKQCGFPKSVSGYEYGRENTEKLYWIKELQII